ncbi:uncharacterized SAM-binding protein YcdF (DUF218 family) [Bradyrhizobium diazoefficiens]
MDCSTRRPAADEIARINRTHLIDTPLRPADLLFMFGTREDTALRADTAARLWREGLFRWSIVSGGVTPGSEQSECTIIKAAMVAAGIPADRILEEHGATNTGENVIVSLPVIDAALGLQNIRSVICLGNTWTARRYPMTLHRHWPEVEKMLLTVDSFATPRALWHTDVEFRRRVLHEWDKIEPYKARGFYRGMAGGLTGKILVLTRFLYANRYPLRSKTLRLLRRVKVLFLGAEQRDERAQA